MGQPGVQYVRGAVWACTAWPPRQTEANRIGRIDLNEDMGIRVIVECRNYNRQRSTKPVQRLWSFEGDAQRRTMVRTCAPENLEIPGSVLPDRPGMTSRTLVTPSTRPS